MRPFVKIICSLVMNFSSQDDYVSTNAIIDHFNGRRRPLRPCVREDNNVRTKWPLTSFVRIVKGKRLERSTPNLVHNILDRSACIDLDVKRLKVKVTRLRKPSRRTVASGYSRYLVTLCCATYSFIPKAVLEVGRYETVCHTGTSLDGYKSYRHFRPEKYHTGTPQWAEPLVESRHFVHIRITGTFCTSESSKTCHF